MIDQPFAQALLLLGTSVAIVIAFQRLRIPSSLGFLLAGLLLGPHTAGPVIESEQIRALAEFGVVFLLFTIGLNFSLPQIHALRHSAWRAAPRRWPARSAGRSPRRCWPSRWCA